MHYHHNNSWLPVSLEKNYRKMVLALFLLWFKLFVLAWEKTEQKMYSPTSKRRIFLQEQAINKDINTKINQRKKCSCWIAKLRWTVKILWVSCETRLAAGMLIKNLKSWVGYIVKWEVGLGGGVHNTKGEKNYSMKMKWYDGCTVLKKMFAILSKIWFVYYWYTNKIFQYLFHRSFLCQDCLKCTHEWNLAMISLITQECVHTVTSSIQVTASTAASAAAAYNHAYSLGSCMTGSRYSNRLFGNTLKVTRTVRKLNKPYSR